GEALCGPARVLHVALRAEIQRAVEGPQAAAEAVRARAGTELDPRIAAAFLKRAPELLAEASAPSAWEAFLDSEPLPLERVPPARLDDVALAFAQYVDVKSPWTLGHST